MATETLRPDGDVQAGAWTTAPLFSKINDQSDTAFITGVGTTLYGIVTFPTPVAVPANVTDFKVRVRLISSITNPDMVISLAGTGSIPDVLVTNHPDPESFAWYEANGAGTPLPEDLDSLKLTINKLSGGGAVDLSQVELVVTYTDAPPTTPGVFTTPLSGETYRDELVVAWGVSTDPEGSPIQYEGEYSSDSGVSWTSLFSLQSGLSYTWDISGLAEGTEYQVRVRAHDGTGYSAAWRESDVFYISVPQCDAGTPDVSGGCTA